jgi:hypothetical protein
MTAAKSKNIARSVLLWGLAVGALVFVLRRVQISQLAEAWTRFHWLWFLGPTVGFFVLLFFLDSYAHFWLVRRFAALLPYREVLRARGASYLLAGLGLLYGQGSMAYILSKKSGRSLAEMAGIITFLAFNTFHALLILPTFALFFFLHHEFAETREFHLLALFAAVAWPLFVLSLCFWITGRPRFIRRRLKASLFIAFDQARLSDYAWIILLRIFQSLVWIGFTALALHCLDLELPASSLLLKLPIVLLIGSIPTPGRLGTTQGAWVLLFASQAPASDLFLFSLAWTLSMNLLRWLTGLLFLRHFSSASS